MWFVFTDKKKIRHESYSLIYVYIRKVVSDTKNEKRKTNIIIIEIQVENKTGVVVVLLQEIINKSETKAAQSQETRNEISEREEKQEFFSAES